MTLVIASGTTLWRSKTSNIFLDNESVFPVLDVIVRMKMESRSRTLGLLGDFDAGGALVTVIVGISNDGL